MMVVVKINNNGHGSGQFSSCLLSCCRHQRLKSQLRPLQSSCQVRKKGGNEDGCQNSYPICRDEQVLELGHAHSLGPVTKQTQ